MNKEIRNGNDCKIIADYLLTLKEFSQLIKDSHSENYKDLIRKISNVLKYEKLNKDELLFRQGDRGDKFYIILKGSVSILIPKLVEVKLSESEYLSYLTNLKINDENDLLVKVIQLNKKIFKTDEEIIEKFLKRQGFVNKGMIRKNSEVMHISKDLADTIKSMLSKDYLKSNKPFCISTDGYIDRLKPKTITSFEGERQYVSVFDYNKILSLGTGNKFGEIALSSTNKKRFS
jgi:CRP-like cAMP-binding protein